jgi:flagellin
MNNSIQTNVSSIGTQRTLRRNNEELSTSFQRLSTGLRINSAKDDAAGLQISNGLTSQINGLGVAVRNANDGISLTQTAEGALQESTHILQRIRDLSLQSASDVNGLSERSALQAEVTQLITELGRIANTTTFGNTNLLDGSFTNKAIQVGAQANERIDVSISSAKATTLGSHILIANGSALGNIVTGPSFFPPSNGITQETNLTLSTFYGGSVSGISYNLDDSAEEIAAAINGAANHIGITATASNSSTLSALSHVGTISFSINGSSISSAVSSVNDLTAIAEAINSVNSISNVFASFSNSNDLSSITLTAIDGRDIMITSFSTSTTIATIELGGTELAEGIFNTPSGNAAGQLTLFSSKGAISGAGANADLFLSSTPKSQLESVADINIKHFEGAQKAISIIDSALNSISSQQAGLGALQNRFNSTINNLSNIIENASAARSRIRDTDFASEIAILAKNQVLQQASLSILAQANASSQSVLTLLQ